FTVAIPAFYVRLKSRVIQWSDRTGFVLADSDADEFERLMREENVHRLARENFGQWVLFHPDAPSASIGGLPGDPRSSWMGLGAVRREYKEKSRYLGALGQRAYGAGDLAGALELSRKAVDSYAFNHTARRTLIHALDGLGRKAEAVEESRRLGSLVDPGVKVSA